jgi:hypothetical protein
MFTDFAVIFAFVFIVVFSIGLAILSKNKEEDKEKEDKIYFDKSIIKEFVNLCESIVKNGGFSVNDFNLHYEYFMFLVEKSSVSGDSEVFYLIKRMQQLQIEVLIDNSKS